MLAFLAIVISLLFLFEVVLGCDVAMSMRLRAFAVNDPSKEIWVGPFANQGVVADDIVDGDYDWTLSALHTFRFSVNRERDSAKLGVSRLPRAPSPDLDYRRDLEAKIRTACRGSTRLRGFQVSVAVRSAEKDEIATVSLSGLALNVSMEMFPLAFESTLTSVNGMPLSPAAVFLDVPPGNEDKSFTLEGTLSLSGQFGSEESSRVQIDACCAPASTPTNASTTAAAMTTTTSATVIGATISTTSATSTFTANASAANTTTALLSISTTAAPSSSAALEPWILGVIVGGAVLALILVGLAVFFLLKRRRAQEPAAASNNNAAELKPQPQSNYTAINVAPPKEYDDGRIDLHSDSPAQNSEYIAVLPKSNELYRV
jgi:hypothetical protein